MDPHQANLPPNLLLLGSRLRFNPTPTFLGVTFERTLSFSKHVSLLKANFFPRLKALPYISACSWAPLRQRYQTRGPRDDSKILNEFRKYCNDSSSNKRLNPSPQVKLERYRFFSFGDNFTCCNHRTRFVVLMMAEMLER